MKLVENWKKAYKMLSIQAMGLSLAIQGAWPMVPDELKATLPQHVINWVAMVLLVAGIVGRLVAQDSVGTPSK